MKNISSNNRGVALLIVLLVTALLIALIFEFAYATRISVNNAVSFRDSERAYYLARSGVYAFIKYGELRNQIPQGEWGVVPVISEGETEVRIKWEDETGKIKITDVKSDNATKSMIQTLFENKSIDREVYTRMIDQTSEVNRITLLSGLHQYMSDEDFSKVSSSLTVNPVTSRKININTASIDVLQSLGIGSGAAELIVQDRQRNPYADLTNVPGIAGLQINGLALSTYLTVSPGTIYTVYAYATVGGYTKTIEAILNGSSITYWRAL